MYVIMKIKGSVVQKMLETQPAKLLSEKQIRN
jgi:hypothetical protein